MPAAARVCELPALGDGAKRRLRDKAALEPDRDRSAAAIEPGDPLGCRQHQRGRRQRLGPRQQRAPEQPVLDDVAERLVADLAMVVVHAQGRVALADLDVEDRLRVGCERRPDPDRLEQAPRARRDRRDPAIEGRRHGRGEARALHEQDAQALAGDGAGERQPGHAAADHKEVEAFAHWRSLARPGRAGPCGKGSQKPLRVAY